MPKKTMKAVPATAKILKVMKMKTVSTIGSIAQRILTAKEGAIKRTGVQGVQSGKAEKAKRGAPGRKVSAKTMMLSIKKKLKEKERAETAALRKREQAKRQEMDRRRKLSPEQRKLEEMVSKDFAQVINHIVKYDDAERLAKVEKEQVSNLPRPSQCSTYLPEDAARDSAVQVGMRLFKDAWYDFVLERDRGNADEEEREDRASAFQENKIAESYEVLKVALLNLIPWVGTLQASGNYHVLERQGYAPSQHLEKGEINYDLLGARADQKKPDLEKLLGSRIACLRSKPDFRAFEAFCAMMSAMSGRKEKNFLELFGTIQDIDSAVNNKPGCKSKDSFRRKEEILKALQEESLHGSGFFAHFIIKTNATIRAAFDCKAFNPMPVSCMITQRMPLFAVLASEDGDNGDAPLQGAAKYWKWCVQEGTEFALQEANFAESDDHRNKKQREPAAELKADPALRALMLDRSKMCVHLDVICSLAPRDVAKKEGHSDIVKAELEMLMRDCKSRGEAVAFTLGSDRPHLLAEKVYMRKPIGNYGLRCGYIRWRASANEPWSRESPWEQRACMMLQMP